MGEVVDFDLGELSAPVAEKLDAPWVFRAACRLKDPTIVNGRLFATVFLDLGFHIYRQVAVLIDGVHIPKDRISLVIEFVLNWAQNGTPNDLEVTTFGQTNEGVWSARIRRAELDIETLKVRGWESLTEALIEQGIADG